MPVIKEKTIFFFSFLSDSHSILLDTYKIDKTMNLVAVDHRIRHTPLDNSGQIKWNLPSVFYDFKIAKMKKMKIERIEFTSSIIPH